MGIAALIVSWMSFASVAVGQTALVGEFTYTMHMKSARVDHTATMLPNGKVLLAGGFDNLSELYNPVTDAWSQTGAMIHTRRLHTATLMVGGQVLVAAGYDGVSKSITSSAEYYDSVHGIWRATGSLNIAREVHTALRLNDGRVMIAGGFTVATLPTETTEVYNVNTGTWSFGPSLNVARWKHTMTMLKDGRVLVVGGIDNSKTSTASVELFDPSSNKWTIASPLKHMRHQPTATLLNDGTVLVVGGSLRTVGSSSDVPLDSVERYDPATDTWSDGPILPSLRHSHTATLLADGKVLVCGGGDGVYVLQSAVVFDPALNAWRNTGSMGQGRDRPTATALPYGEVLVTGGSFTRNNVKTVTGAAEIYDSLFGPPIPAGTYQGLVHNDGLTALSPSPATEGMFNLTTDVDGNFSAKLTLEGQTLNLLGLIDGYGVARFGDFVDTSLVVPRVGKPPVKVAFTMDLGTGPNFGKITGTLTRRYRQSVASVSNLSASRAAYSLVNPMPSSQQTAFTVVMQAGDLSALPAGFSAKDYPQGFGFGTGKFSSQGTATFVGKLADGTAFTASTQMGTDQSLPLYASLYGDGGFFEATLAVMGTWQTPLDLRCQAQWMKPFTNGQYYPYGWPEVIPLNLLGARFLAPPGVNCFGFADGNGRMTFETSYDAQGHVSSSEMRFLRLTPLDVASQTGPFKDPGFTFVMNRATGSFTGTFTPMGSAKATFQGVAYQSVYSPGINYGYGYFLSPLPKVLDYQGFSGGLVFEPSF